MSPYARALAWAHLWHRAYMHCNAGGPRSRLPRIERRICRAMQRCHACATGQRQ